MMHLFKNASITKLHVSEHKPQERQITPPRKEKQVVEETKRDKKQDDLLYLEAEKQLGELKIKLCEAREAETKARQEAHQKARQAREAEIKAREEAEKNSFEEAQKKAALEEAENKARQEVEKQAREEAQKKVREVKKKAREEVWKKKSCEEVEKKAHQEAEKKAIEAEESKKAQIKSEAEKNNAVVQKYTPQLHQLFELGFKDVSRNLKLLVTFNGRLEDVINTLLS